MTLRTNKFNTQIQKTTASVYIAIRTAPSTRLEYTMYTCHVVRSVNLNNTIKMETLKRSVTLEDIPVMNFGKYMIEKMTRYSMKLAIVSSNT